MMKKLFTFCLSILMVTSLSAIDYVATMAGVWSEPLNWEPIGVPGATDNVNVGAIKITVDVDAACANLTFASTAAAGNLLMNANLTVNGTIDCATSLDIDLMNGSSANSKLILTGAALAQNGTIGFPKGTATVDAPIVYLITDNALRCIRPKNLEIATTGAGIFTLGLLQPTTFNISAGKTVVKTGSNVNILGRTNIGRMEGVNEFTIESGATVYTRVLEGGFEGRKINSIKLVLNGTLITSVATSIKNIVMGENAVFKYEQVTIGFPGWSGWWHNVTPTGTPPVVAPGDFATPGSLVFGANSTIELNAPAFNTAVPPVAISQSIQGIIPQNKLYYSFIGGVPVYCKKTTIIPEDSIFVSYTVPYVNIVASGGGTKTVESNLVAKGHLTVAVGTTFTIPAAKAMVVGGTITGTPTVLGLLVNTSVSDVARGSVSAVISAANEVTLTAMANPGYRFVSWQDVAPQVPVELGTSNSLVVTYADATTRNIQAIFAVGTGLSANKKAASIVTVSGRTINLNTVASYVEVYTAQGSLVKALSNASSVEVSNGGIYIVKMNTAQGVSVDKVMVK